MTNREMAESYLVQAGEIIVEARGAFDRGVWNLVVRRSQEVVEIPESFRKDIERMASISRRLRREREASFYGDEETGSLPHQLYAEDDARQALQDADFVLERCRLLVQP